jgi:hypothetical protein
MVLVQKKDDFTNTEIVASYQNHAEKFFQAWVHLWLIEGITNYIHMMDWVTLRNTNTSGRICIDTHNKVGRR